MTNREWLLNKMQNMSGVNNMNELEQLNIAKERIGEENLLKLFK